MADTNTTPQDRIRIYNRAGIELAEFRASVERSWALGDEGRAEFYYPVNQPKVVNDNVLRYGNWMFVQNSALPPWVGVLDTPRDWNNRQVVVRAYTPEHVFGQRRGPTELKLTGSAGAIFAKLIDLVNAPELTVIRSGNIWFGGIGREQTINPTPLNNELENLWERSGEDYTWRPSVDASGRLFVFGDWFKKLGVDYDVHLHQGTGGGNIEMVSNVLVEDGDIINDFMAYGDGLSWTSKPYAVISDTDSAGKYGLRQGSREYFGVSTVGTLQEHAAEFIRKNSKSIKAFRINALNKGATFNYIGLGNTLNLRLQNAGFMGESLGYETNVRITGMSYDPDIRNKIELVCEEQ